MNMRPVYEETEITKALQLLLEVRDDNSADKAKHDALNLAIDAITNKTIPVTPKNDGETSDGYHTFNELYHHLCAVLHHVRLPSLWEQGSNPMVRPAPARMLV